MDTALFELDPEATPDTPPFLIGIKDSSGPLHAVAQQHADNSNAPTACGTGAVAIRAWGSFLRGNDRLELHSVCPHCTWAVALEHNTTNTELATLIPSIEDQAALKLAGLDPLLVFRVCEAILTARQADNADADPDHPQWARFLAHVTLHRPVLLLPEGCSEGDCDDEDRAGCYGEKPTVACMPCSVLTGSEAGEWEGQVVHRADAPCSAFLAVSTKYLGGGRG